jgi:hypothetical protein
LPDLAASKRPLPASSGEAKVFGEAWAGGCSFWLHAQIEKSIAAATISRKKRNPKLARLRTKSNIVILRWFWFLALLDFDL